ncbi:N-acetylmuramoyl-L-alanine amidase [Citreimonas salinaria]|nr:N-acetylmuramoyl-L-alanine amidase [Citreimonas salinaria]
MIVLHYTAMKDAVAARDWLCNPESQVSAHYLIGRDGTLWQMVDEDARAWHAGAGAWGACADVNSRSIGIELDNDGATPFAAPLMDRLEDLLRGIMRRWSIPSARVVAHSDIAPGRKIDPGRRFDWRRLALQDLSVWPEPATPGDAWVDLRRAGYRWAEGQEDAVLGAFRSRFRPDATALGGAPDRVDAALAAGLAAGFPCVD